MMFFRRNEVTVRCAHRGLALSVPDRDRLLNSCEPRRRRQLQRYLGYASANEPSWSVQWRKIAGEQVQPQDVVATLRRDGVIVELTYAQKGVLAEQLVAQGEQVDTGKRLAVLERRAKASASSTAPTNDVLRQFVAQQRRDADLIAALRAEIATHDDLVERLSSEIAALRGGRPPGVTPVGDVKFRRLKQEFSKHFHPDALPPGNAEREHRARVFQEFWPILEKIERS